MWVSLLYFWLSLTCTYALIYDVFSVSVQSDPNFDTSRYEETMSVYEQEYFKDESQEYLNKVRKERECFLKNTIPDLTSSSSSSL